MPKFQTIYNFQYKIYLFILYRHFKNKLLILVLFIKYKSIYRADKQIINQNDKIKLTG